MHEKSSVLPHTVERGSWGWDQVLCISEGMVTSTDKILWFDIV